MVPCPTEEEIVEVDTGITAAAREEIADGLARLLADSYTLYLKTHAYHWNVTGPMFNSLHTMFETHYLELRDAVDEIAERIRALGFPAPGSYAAFARLASVAEEEGVPAAMDMVRDLAHGHEAVVRTARSVVALAEQHEDQATADLVTQRLHVHEKTAWMLRATAE
jgi:starvation-inducible DNA-binding protein